MAEAEIRTAESIFLSTVGILKAFYMPHVNLGVTRAKCLHTTMEM